MYTHLEDYIRNLFLSIGITEPNKLDMYLIAKKLGAKIVYNKRSYRFNNEVLLTRGSPREQWIMFCHEICHYLRHSGNAFNMNKLFIDLQEWQANYFAYHFAVPTFMLENLDIKTAQDIVNHFDVNYDFALRRLEMYRNNHIYYKLDHIKEENHGIYYMEKGQVRGNY